jgi:hypothetical protein
MLTGEEFNGNLDQAREQLRVGVSLETLLCELRQNGSDKIDSIKIVKAAMNLTMAQSAHSTDHLSPVVEHKGLLNKESAFRS